MGGKNILFLTKTLGVGGTEKVVMQLCSNMRSNFDKIVVCSSGGVHENQLKKLGIKHYKIPDFDNKSILNIICTFNIIRRIIKQEHIEIIHSHHRMAALYANILSRFYDMRVIHTMHNTFTDKKMLTKIALKNLEVVAVGESVKKNLIELYEIDSKKISVIYNGIDEKESSDKYIELIGKYRKDDYFLVGNIGRLSEQKGMEYFINAAKVIKQSGLKVKFFIVGDGELREELEKQVRVLKLEDDIVFLGYRSDIADIISNLDLVILSSLWEGLPLTPIEVFMNKKTIIATEVGGTAEIVKDNYNGMLVPIRDTDKIAEGIMELYTNKELLSKFEKNAYKTYRERFGIEQFIMGYKQLYNKEL